MCGRFFREDVSWHNYRDALDLTGDDPEEPHGEAYNVAPTQQSPIAVQTEDGVEIRMARWGLIPRFFHKPLSEWKASTFNARIESAATSASYRAAWKDRPCLALLSGWYEWTGPKGAKQPWAISMETNHRCFAVAGLWDSAKADQEDLFDSFTIITQPARDGLEEVHSRMPGLLRPEHYRDWLLSKPEDRSDLLRAFEANRMRWWKVGKAVGNVSNQGRSLIDQV
ncbi:MAG: SOS response-associated peptidase [Pseudomonadota bacterium]